MQFVMHSSSRKKEKKSNARQRALRKRAVQGQKPKAGERNRRGLTAVAATEETNQKRDVQ